MRLEAVCEHDVRVHGRQIEMIDERLIRSNRFVLECVELLDDFRAYFVVVRHVCEVCFRLDGDSEAQHFVEAFFQVVHSLGVDVELQWDVAALRAAEAAEPGGSPRRVPAELSTRSGSSTGTEIDRRTADDIERNVRRVVLLPLPLATTCWRTVRRVVVPRDRRKCSTSTAGVTMKLWLVFILRCDVRRASAFTGFCGMNVQEDIIKKIIDAA